VFTSLSPLADYSGSALRFGLIDIKPVEVVESIKKFGLRFKKVTRTFELSRPVKSFEDLVTFQNETVFNAIEIPEWFDAKKLVHIYSQRSIEKYERDKELKMAVEELKTSERKGKPLLSFIQFIKKRFEDERDYYIELEAEMFLNSNFPFSLYNKFVVFDNLYCDFLQVLEDRVKWHEFKASSSRNFFMYQKRIAEMKKEIGPLIDKFDECLFSLICLKKYIIIWNAKSYDEIFNLKFLDINNVDFSKFEELYNNFNIKLRETKESLLHYDPKILDREINQKEYTREMFGKFVTLPSNSLDLKR
jgi:hypothetical protein